MGFRQLLLGFFYVLSFASLQGKEKPDLLSFGVGAFEVVRHNHNMTAEFRIEYKPSLEWYTIRPALGFMMTVKGSTYLYGGFGFDWVIKDRLLFSPNFAVGWYRAGGGKNLGFPLEFRSGVEMGWCLKNGTRLGALFYHLSNASLGSRNPGEESLEFFYSVPLR